MQALLYALSRVGRVEREPFAGRDEAAIARILRARRTRLPAAVPFASEPPAIQRFYRIVRAVLALNEDLREPFSGKLECDETTFGAAKKSKRGWGAAGKVIVFGIIKHNGRVKAMPITAHSGAEVLRCIREAHHTRLALLYGRLACPRELALTQRLAHLLV